MTQLVLTVEEPLMFVACCAMCGRVLDVIPVEDGDNWGAAALWSHIAIKAHQPTCDGRRDDGPAGSPAVRA